MLIWPNLSGNWPTIQDISASTRLWGRFCWPETAVLIPSLKTRSLPLKIRELHACPKGNKSSCKHPFSGANCEFWGVHLPSVIFCPATFFSVKLRPLKRRGSPCTRSKVGRVDESVGGKIRLPKRLRRLEKEIEETELCVNFSLVCWIFCTPKFQNWLCWYCCWFTR